MINKDQLASGMLRECDICKHLFTKLTPEAYSYRPSATQRTTLELLRYLSIIGIAGIRCLAENNWKLLGEYSAKVKDMPTEDFPAAMDRQKGEISAFFASVSEHTLETQKAPLPGVDPLPLGEAILGGPFKWLAAYKLQLFLYAKGTGATQIGTANAWAGIDWRG